MKLKYFLIGLLTTLLLLAILGFGGFKYIQQLQKKDLDAYVSEEINSLEIELIQLTKEDINNIELKTIKDGRVINTTQQKYLFINFWATWCAPCVSELPVLQNLIKDNEINTLPVQFVFSSKEELPKQKEFLAENNYELNFCKPTDSLPAIFNSKIIPVTFIINTKNNTAYKITGTHNWNSELIRTFFKGLI